MRSPVQNSFRSPWAVKKLLKRNNHKTNKMEERLKTEAAVLRTLNHPNIVGFRGYAIDSNILVMEHCNISLGDLIEERLEICNVPYAADIILKVCYDVAKALDYLHNEVLLLHSDIKSYNVLVINNFDVCKLCDFGVTLPLTKTGELDIEKANGALYEGTPCWSAPEVSYELPQITTKVDIYAFGLVIWEMIALQPPVTGNYFDQTDSFLSDNSLTENSVITETVKLRPDLPDIEFTTDYNPVLEMYYCCTVVEPKKRPSASDIVSLLKDIVK